MIPSPPHKMRPYTLRLAQCLIQTTATGESSFNVRGVRVYYFNFCEAVPVPVLYLASFRFSVFVSLCLRVSVSPCLCLSLSVSLSLCLSVFLVLCLSVSLCLSLFSVSHLLSICLSLCFFVFLFSLLSLNCFLFIFYEFSLPHLAFCLCIENCFFFAILLAEA